MTVDVDAAVVEERDAVDAGVIVSSRLVLTGHPLQRAGARTVAVLAGRGSVDEVTDADLDRVVEEIVGAAVPAALADLNQPGYGWNKVLQSFFPNSAIQQKSYKTKGADFMRGKVMSLFDADVLPTSGDSDDSAVNVLSCTFCGQGTFTVWAKSTLPMVGATGMRNTCPPGLDGWPVCRACRIALWALPFGAYFSASHAAVVTGPDEVEEKFIRVNVGEARRLISVNAAKVRSSGWDAAPAALSITAHVNTLTPRSVTVWVFYNNNQSPVLKVYESRAGVLPWLHKVQAVPVLRAGFTMLVWNAAYGDGWGRGFSRVSRDLFPQQESIFGSAGNGNHDDFLFRAYRCARSAAEKRNLEPARVLFPLVSDYMKEVLMKPAPQDLEMFAGVIAGMITDRGSFQSFTMKTKSGRDLGEWLLARQHRGISDGTLGRALNPGMVAAVTDAKARDLRTQLFFYVCAALSESALADISGVGSASGTEDDEAVGSAVDMVIPDDVFAHDFTALVDDDKDEEQYA